MHGGTHSCKIYKPLPKQELKKVYGIFILHLLGHLPEKNQRSFVSSLVLNENFFVLALVRDMREMGG